MEKLSDGIRCGCRQHGRKQGKMTNDVFEPVAMVVTGPSEEKFFMISRTIAASTKRRNGAM